MTHVAVTERHNNQMPEENCMNSGSFYETSVKRKSDKEIIIKKTVFIALYVLSVIGWLVFGLATRAFIPLIALIPITLWVLIFATWRYTSVEYEYSLVTDILTVSKIYGGRSRKVLLEIPIKDAVLIAPLNDTYAERSEKYAPQTITDATSDINSDSVYFILYEDKESGKRSVLYLDMNETLLKALRRINPSSAVIMRA